MRIPKQYPPIRQARFLASVEERLPAHDSATGSTRGFAFHRPYIVICLPSFALG